MGLFDAQAKPFRRPTAQPVLSAPTITNAPIVPVGLSRDGKTVIGASTASPWQLHYSTDDCSTWSVGQLAAGDVSQILGAIELPTGELLLTFASARAISRTGGWKNRSMATAGLMTSTGVMTARASGIAPRPQWGFGNFGELTLAAEYGSKTADPATSCRYIFLSKDDGSTFVPIFDLYSQDVRGIPGLEMVPAAGGYHCHAVAYDKWADRIWATGGDSNDWIIYSDNASRIEIVADIATTSGQTTITSAAGAAKRTFAARHVGMEIRGAGIPAGTTIASVTNAYTAVLSQAASATATGVLIWMGNITWTVHHYGRAGRYQVVGILPTEQGVFFGADGYPTGIHFSQRGVNGRPAVLENILNTDPTFKTNVGQHLQMGIFRAAWYPDAPILISGDSNDADTGAYVALVHPSHKRVWELWRDPYAAAYSGCQQIWYTAQGNIIGQMKSARTAAGWQLFKAPMPVLPSASAL